jgi:hypothetical protein
VDDQEFNTELHTVENEEQPSAPLDARPPIEKRATNGHQQQQPQRRSLWSADRDAEAALLGAFLRGADPTLVPLDAWTLPCAQAVHHACLQLHDPSGRPLDLRLVAAAIGPEVDRLQVDVDGVSVLHAEGRAALALLDARAPSVYDAERLADVVLDHARRRKLALTIDRAEAALRAGDARDAIAQLATIENLADAPDSWAFVDLAAAIDNPETIRPTILARSDGQHLLYRGKIHAFNAESESGKSFLALYACVEQIARGHHVAYLDFEDDERGAIERLEALGLGRDDILEYFHYVRPDDAYDTTTISAVIHEIERLHCTLVVLDGVTEAMNLNGWSVLDNDEIAAFYKLLPRRIARTGAAVLDIDHVPKKKDERGKGGIGGQHKRAGITGAAYNLDVVRPFGRGLDGRVKITVDKDRLGYVRPQAAGGQHIADLAITSDADTGAVNINLYPPATAERVDGGAWDGPTQCMEAVRHWFAEHPDEEVSLRQLPDRLRGAGVSYRDSTVRAATEGLVDRGELTARTGPRSARLIRLAPTTNPRGETANGMF